MSGQTVCPNCKLENRRGEARCAGCGNTLPRFAAIAKAPAARDSEETQAVLAADVQRLLAERRAPPAPVAAPAPESAPAVAAVAWLHCEPLAPLALVPGSAVTIGRKGCQLLLAHTEVSRHHATIGVLSSGEISITDHGSSNGTSVNGKRVATQTLRIGDQIKIGPYAIELWQVKDLPVEDPEHTSAIPLPGDPELSGKLGALTLAAVLAAIQAGKRTGTLSVADRQQRGTIRFLDGAVVEAEWGPLRADAAVKEMSALAFGSFAFLPD